MEGGGVVWWLSQHTLNSLNVYYSPQIQQKIIIISFQWTAHQYYNIAKMQYMLTCKVLFGFARQNTGTMTENCSQEFLKQSLN